MTVMPQDRRAPMPDPDFVHPELVAPETRSSQAFRYLAAALRLSIGWVFLWAFLDKLLALGFATGRNPVTGAVDRFSAAAWINGGSPTESFLLKATSGPFAEFYQSFAGADQGERDQHEGVDDMVVHERVVRRGQHGGPHEN